MDKSARDAIQPLYTPEAQRAISIAYLKMFATLGWLITAIGTLFNSAIAHLFLMLAGGANKPFHVTLRVFCFSGGSVMLLLVFPVCGVPLYLAWMMVCCVIGLTVAHDTTTGRSLTAMALLVAASFVCCMGVASLAFAATYDSLRPMLNQ